MLPKTRIDGAEKFQDHFPSQVDSCAMISLGRHIFDLNFSRLIPELKFSYEAELPQRAVGVFVRHFLARPQSTAVP